MTASPGDNAADPQQIVAELRRKLDEVTAQQVATAEILKVIASSPSDVQPMFDAIASSALRLFNGYAVGVVVAADDRLEIKAVAGFDENASRAMIEVFPRPIDRETVTGRVILEGAVVQVPDTEASDVPQRTKAVNRAVNVRALMGAPIQRDGIAIGAILVTRQQPGAFSDEQIMLLRTFADQAVIAIENVRLFNEVQAKTRDLTEALEQQTATSEVLEVISRSAFNLQIVLYTLVESAAHLCDADEGTIFQPRDDAYRLTASCGLSPPRKVFLESCSFQPGTGSTIGRVLLEGKTVHIEDSQTDLNYRFEDEMVRTRLGVPLLREGGPIGVFVLTRRDVRPFSDKQIELVQTFADQAVIAIENVRLFDEVQAKTRDLTEALTYQTGSSNILSVIASSPTDVGPVLDAIVESACELCEAYDAVVLLKDGDDLRFSAHHGPIAVDIDKWPISRDWASGRAVVDRATVHVPDVFAEEACDFTASRKFSSDHSGAGGIRSVLAVPLLRERESIGAILLRRQEAHPFSDKQIALLQTFADQAVIAIGNVRMFEQVQERTKQLSLSLNDLRTAQDRLVQTEKLASLGQLTAGIAHEIKNPLNFVNNFSALSAELVGEMKDALSDVNLAKNKREELDEIAQMLKANLEKVVQHGKRADSIVKNMLQHSREGSGEHRPVDINAIVDESLNLAYHGARAEKAGFSIVLQRDLDPSVGMADVYPQEITRVLLNLISNGFYATARRKVDAGDGFEPTISAATKNLGDKVEIRIRDNGTGIPEEVKEKIFNPFFTTKPPGEGTGLGLSMSHDIIVKQHGGSIDVETEPGVFTEFKIVLPRTIRK